MLKKGDVTKTDARRTDRQMERQMKNIYMWSEGQIERKTDSQTNMQRDVMKDKQRDTVTNQ